MECSFCGSEMQFLAVKRPSKSDGSLVLTTDHKAVGWLCSHCGRTSSRGIVVCACDHVAIDRAYASSAPGFPAAVPAGYKPDGSVIYFCSSCLSCETCGQELGAQPFVAEFRGEKHQLVWRHSQCAAPDPETDGAPTEVWDPSPPEPASEPAPADASPRDQAGEPRPDPSPEDISIPPYLRTDQEEDLSDTERRRRIAEQEAWRRLVLSKRRANAAAHLSEVRLRLMDLERAFHQKVARYTACMREGRCYRCGEELAPWDKIRGLAEHDPCRWAARMVQPDTHYGRALQEIQKDPAVMKADGMAEELWRIEFERRVTLQVSGLCMKCERPLSKLDHLQNSEHVQCGS